MCYNVENLKHAPKTVHSVVEFTGIYHLSNTILKDFISFSTYSKIFYRIKINYKKKGQ